MPDVIRAAAERAGVSEQTCHCGSIPPHQATIEGSLVVWGVTGASAAGEPPRTIARIHACGGTGWAGR